MKNPQLIFFHRFALLTLFIIYILIFIGSSVRASGAGMGCPDWPTCFGQWIPPVSIDELPEDYQTIYLDRGYDTEKFNVIKTWTEYVNRIFGVLTGLFIFALFLLSIPLRQKHSVLFYTSLSATVLVAFQGWLGSKVISTKLMPGIITIHMLVAILITVLVLYTFFKSKNYSNDEQMTYNIPSTFMFLVGVALLFSLIQIVMGTQVREMIDFAQQANYQRGEWVSLLSDFFYIHRGFSWVILAINAYLLKKMFDLFKIQAIFKHQLLISILLIIQVTTGTLLNHLNVPAYIQPFHLLVAILLISLQFSLLYQLRQSKKMYSLLNT